MTELTLAAGDATATVAVADGARIASLRVGGLDLVGRGTQSPHGWGAFPMAPWAGRVRDGVLTWEGESHQLPVSKPPHAIHGLVARQPWEVREATEGRAHLSRQIGDGWPWPGHVELRYELAADRLETRLTVHADAVAMPAWCGVHPWFSRRLTGAGGETAEVAIDLTAGGMLARDEAGIATGRQVPVPDGAPIETPVDDCFTDVSWPVVLSWPGVARLEVSASSSYAVVFTERDAAVCVEPQTAPPDAAALGLAHVAEPGAPHELRMSWRWSLSTPSGAGPRPAAPIT